MPNAQCPMPHAPCPEGELVLTPAEVAHQEKQRSDRLAAKLRELGIDPDIL